MLANPQRFSRLRPIAGRILLGLLAAVMVATASPPAAAQSLWMAREGEHTIMFEMLRPSIEDVDAEFLSAAFFLSGRAAVSSHVAVVGELPYANHKSSLMGTDINGFEIVTETSSSTFGNPYLGIETRAESSPISAEVGARIPLASDKQIEAFITGYYSDVIRQDAFLPKFTSIVAAFNLREVTPSKVAYRLRLSPVLAIPTEGLSDTELFAVYSFQIGYQGAHARIGGGMSGRALVTDSFSNLGYRTLNQLELHADFLSGAFRPGLDLRLPLGDVAALIPVALGASVSWTR
jgi:hypothetical protein